MSKSKTVTHLNAVLRNELTSINQYFLHARILKHMGLTQLADFEYKESIDEMKYADKLIERILKLGGAPNLQHIGTLYIGEEVGEILQNDLKLEEAARLDLLAAIRACKDAGDEESATLLEDIERNEETHMDFLRGQLEHIQNQGKVA